MSLHDDIVSKAFQVGEFVVVEFLLVLSFKNLQCSLNMVVFNVMWFCLYDHWLHSGFSVVEKTLVENQATMMHRFVYTIIWQKPN